MAARGAISSALAMHVGSLKRFCHPYYAVHVLVILSYAAVRMLFQGESLMMFVPDGFMGLTRVRWRRCRQVFLPGGAARDSSPRVPRPPRLIAMQEQEIGVMGVLYLFARARKASTIDEIVGTTILIGKTVVIAWSWYMDTRVLLWYLVAYLSVCRHRDCAAAAPPPHPPPQSSFSSRNDPSTSSTARSPC